MKDNGVFYCIENKLVYKRQLRCIGWAIDSSSGRNSYVTQGAFSSVEEKEKHHGSKKR